MKTYRFKVKHRGFDGELHTIVVCVKPADLKDGETETLIEWLKGRGIDCVCVNKMADSFTKEDLIAYRRGTKISKL